MSGVSCASQIIIDLVLADEFVFGRKEGLKQGRSADLKKQVNNRL